MKVPVGIVRKMERLNEAVYRAQAIEDEIMDWIEQSGALDGGEIAFDLICDFRESSAESVDVDGLVTELESR